VTYLAGARGRRLKAPPQKLMIRQGLACLALPAIGTRLGQADVVQDAVGELAGHFFEAIGVVVEGGDERVDGGSCVGGAVHVADVDFAERGFADAEHQGTLFLEADVGGTLDELSGDAVSDTGQGADGAWKHDHRVGGVRAAGDIGADIGVGLRVDLFRVRAQQLADEVGAAGEFEFFGHDAEGAVGGNEVDGADAGVLFGGAEEFAQEESAASAGSGYGEVIKFFGGF
jgi:hypothetical protein